MDATDVCAIGLVCFLSGICFAYLIAIISAKFLNLSNQESYTP